MIEKVIEKLSTYNIFNYLFPGAIFTYLLNYIFRISIMQSDIIINVFLYYFVGLVISRLGSVVIEPFLKWVKWVKFSEYSDFITASSKDAKIDLFSEINNMYRTLISLFSCLMVVKLFLMFSEKITFLKENSLNILLIFLLILFLFAYKKQTSYITKRVEKNK